MPEVQGIDKLFSITPARRFGLFNQYGTLQYGFSHYGEEDIFILFTEYGNSRYGVDKYANILCLSGIYRRDNVTGKLKYYRELYYIPKNPQSLGQQTHREKYAAGIVAWKALTNEEKEIYNQKAIGKRMSGYNLFLKVYLLS